MPGICGTLSNSAPELRCGTLLIVNTYCGQHNFSAICDVGEAEGVAPRGLETVRFQICSKWKVGGS